MHFIPIPWACRVECIKSNTLSGVARVRYYFPTELHGSVVFFFLDVLVSQNFKNLIVLPPYPPHYCIKVPYQPLVELGVEFHLVNYQFWAPPCENPAHIMANCGIKALYNRDIACSSSGERKRLKIVNFDVDGSIAYDAPRGSVVQVIASPHPIRWSDSCKVKDCLEFFLFHALIRPRRQGWWRWRGWWWRRWGGEVGCGYAEGGMIVNDTSASACDQGPMEPSVVDTRRVTTSVVSVGQI